MTSHSTTSSAKRNRSTRHRDLRGAGALFAPREFGARRGRHRCLGAMLAHSSSSLSGLVHQMGWLPAALLCLSSVASQRQWFEMPSFEGTYEEVMVWDSARECVTYFGGRGLSPTGRSATWEWNGRVWVRRAPRSTPATRYSAAMVYDSARRRTVLVGGLGENELLRDTWEWDGVDWTQRSPARYPVARANHGAAFDARRQRTVLFGGEGINGLRSDTWEWDGNSWFRLVPANRPAPRKDFAMGYDPVGGRTLLFGGQGQSGLLADTWAWDGNDWTRLSPASQLAPQSGHAMAFDEGRQRLVMIGLASPRRTYEWDGSNWIVRNSGIVQDPGCPIAYDGNLGQVIVYYGRTQELWGWAGNRWVRHHWLWGPTARADLGMAYDPRRQRVMLFGGRFGWSRGSFGFWEWDGATWTERSSSGMPRSRMSPGMTYDRARGELFVFGGRRDLTSQLNDTWVWGGSVWAQRTPAVVPPERTEHSVAYDERRQRVVLFGGVNNNGLLNDTWEWDGTIWRQRFPRNSPRARRLSAMSYHAPSQRVVLFGGWNGALRVRFDETWEWDGDNWTLRNPASRPTARNGHALARNDDRGAVVLYGGEIGGGTMLPDLWEWDGNDWTDVTPSGAGGPGRRWLHRIVYDEARQHLLLFGGVPPGATNSSFFDDLWVLGVVPEVAPYGAGCSGATGVPGLGELGQPTPGNADFGLQVRNAPPAGAGVMLVSPSPHSLSLGGSCTLLVDPAASVAVPMVANQGGFVKFSLPLPTSLWAHRGASLFFQAVTLDPQGSFAGFAAFSNGLRVRIGG